MNEPGTGIPRYALDNLSKTKSLLRRVSGEETKNLGKAGKKKLSC